MTQSYIYMTVGTVYIYIYIYECFYCVYISGYLPIWLLFYSVCVRMRGLTRLVLTGWWVMRPRLSCLRQRVLTLRSIDRISAATGMSPAATGLSPAATGMSLAAIWMPLAFRWSRVRSSLAAASLMLSSPHMLRAIHENQETLPCVGWRVTASQLGLPSLTPLSVAGCGRLQLGAPNFATSVVLLQVVDNLPNILW